jgi:hypothetical protein
MLSFVHPGCCGASRHSPSFHRNRGWDQKALAHAGRQETSHCPAPIVVTRGMTRCDPICSRETNIGAIDGWRSHQQQRGLKRHAEIKLERGSRSGFS